MNAVDIRPARPGDTGGIIAVVEAAYRGVGGWTTEAHLVGGTRTTAYEIETLRADAAVELLVAEGEDGGIDGCCYTAAHGDRAEFGLFAVAPRRQSAGLGRRLLRAQIDLRARQGLRALEIHVLQSRPELHAWYLRQGFLPTGETIPFPGDAADLRVSGLRMEVMELALPGPA